MKVFPVAAVRPGLNLDMSFSPFVQQQKRKLRLYISNTFNPAKSDADDSDGSIASWELRVEGKLLDDVWLTCSSVGPANRGCPVG